MIYNCLVEVYKDGHLYSQTKEFYSEIISKDPVVLDSLIEEIKKHNNADNVRLYKLSSII